MEPKTISNKVKTHRKQDQTSHLTALVFDLGFYLKEENNIKRCELAEKDNKEKKRKVYIVLCLYGSKIQFMSHLMLKLFVKAGTGQSRSFFWNHFIGCLVWSKTIRIVPFRSCDKNRIRQEIRILYR